ncbi:hypothetical protein PHET_09081 [Paragonimus heterotremus]|uniref:Uncharacterized protein n=1 Tax=Paragonimus heterotremus TaxID=100268 RepID=A0A8J4SNQ9_9TREM|nr:hypothetical protein PHET_09081 [Paragonimus heterotremus]
METKQWKPWNVSLKENVILVHAPRMLMENTRHVYLDDFGPVMAYVCWSQCVVDKKYARIVY